MDPVSPNVPNLNLPTQPEQSWLSIPLQLRPELEFDVRIQKGRRIHLIEDPIRGTYYQVGEREFSLIQDLDGVRSLGEILHSRCETENPFNETDVNQIAAWLIQCNLAFFPTAENCHRMDQQANALKKQKLASLINPISIKLNLFNPTRILELTEPFSRWLFTKSFFLVWLLMAITGLYSLLGNWDKLTGSSVGILAEGRWIWMLGVWIVLKAIHELAHGLACQRFGGRVPEAGVLLLLFTPMPFVNVTSSWRFRNRWHRFLVAGAGMYIELFISFLAMIVWANSSHAFVIDLCFNIFFLSSITTVLFNANPLMRFDGYYMLTDVLDLPNLYSKGFRWFGDRLKWLLFGIPRSNNFCQPSEIAFVRVYGLFAFVWKVLITISLLIAASVLFYGIGLLFAVVAGFFWVAVPVFRYFKSVFNSTATDFQWKRAGISAAIIAGSILLGFTVLRSPATKSAPAVVQFENEHVLRANGDGFVKSILVEDGQRVRAGDTLATLFNDQLTTEVANLERKVAEATIQARIYTRDKQLMEAQTEIERRESLAKQLAEKKSQLENLVVTSPINGYVFQRNLANQVGKYFEQGDELLTVAETCSRKIVVSIAQQDLESLQNDRLNSMRVVLSGQPVFRARLSSIDSRATDKPSIPAFCASYGGPLAVEPLANTNDDSPQNRFRLLSPRFNVELLADETVSSRLHSGQIGRAYFDAQQQSLGSYLYLEIENWISRQVEQAMSGH